MVKEEIYIKNINQKRTELFNKIRYLEKSTILSILEQMIKELDYETVLFWINNL